MNMKVIQPRVTPIRQGYARSSSCIQSKFASAQGNGRKPESSISRNLPSTNPLREPNPDITLRSERITSTSVPAGLSFSTQKQNLFKTNPTKQSEQASKESIIQFTQIIHQKNLLIEQLKNQIGSENQIRKLISELENMNSELEKSRQNEIKLTAIVSNYDDQINQLTEQNMRYAKELKEIAQQNECLIAQLGGGDQNIKSRLLDLQKQHGEDMSLMQTRMSETVAQINRNSSQQIDNLLSQNEQLTSECEKLTSLVGTLEQELRARGDINQLTLILQQRNIEIDNARNKATVLAEEKSKMEQKVLEKSSEILRLENQVNIWKDHCNNIQRQAPDHNKFINELQSKIATLEGQLNQLTRDNEKLNKLLEIKDNEVQDVKRENRECSIQTRANEALERELYLSRIEITQKENSIQDLQSRIRDFEAATGQKSPNELTLTINKLTNEIDSLTSHLRSRTQEYQDLQQRHNELLEHQKAQALIRSSYSEYNYDTGFMQQQKLRDQESRFNEQAQKSIVLGHEIEKLAQLVRQQADEIKLLKNTLADAEQKNHEQSQIIQSQVTAETHRQVITQLQDNLRMKQAETIEWQQSYLNLQSAKEREINGIMESFRKEIRPSSSNNLGMQNEHSKLKENASELTRQNEKLLQLIEENQNEIRLLRSQLSDSRIRSTDVSNENMILQTEIINANSTIKLKDNEIASLHRQLSEVRSRFNGDSENQLIQTRSQIQTLQQLLIEKDHTIASLQQQLASYQVDETVKRSQQILHANRLEQNIEELTAECARLKQHKSESQSTIDSLNRQLLELQSKSYSLTDMQQKLDSNQFIIADLEKQRKSLSQELESLQRQLFNTESTKHVRVRDLESQVSALTEESRKLARDLSECRQESMQKQILQQRDIDTNSLRKNELEQQCDVLASEISKLNSLLRMRESELDVLRRESSSRGFSSDIEKHQMQFQLSEMAKELESLNKLLRLKSEEFSRANQLLNEHQKHLQRIPILESTQAQSAEEIHRLNAQITQLNSDTIHKLNEEILTLKNKLQASIDFERVKHDYESRIAYFQQELERNTVTITTISQENLKLHSQVAQLNAQERTRSELNQKLESLRSEKERTESENQQLRNRVFEAAQREKHAIEAEHKLQAQTTEIERLKVALDSKHAEINSRDLLILDFQHIKNLNADLESKAAILSSDNTRINESLKRLAEENASLRSLETLQTTLENKINLLSTDNTRLNALLRAKDEELVNQINSTKLLHFQQLQNQNTDLLAKNSQNIAEIDRAKSEISQKSTQISALEQKVSQLTSQQVSHQLHEQHRNLSLQRDIDNMRIELSTITSKNTTLQSEKQQLQTQLTQLEALIATLKQQHLDQQVKLSEQSDIIKHSHSQTSNQLLDSESQIRILKEELTKKSNELEQQISRIQQLQIELENYKQLESRVSHKSAQLQSKSDEAESLQRHLTNQIEQYSRLQEEFSKVFTLSQTLESKLSIALQNLESTKAELNRAQKQQQQNAEQFSVSNQVSHLEQTNAQLNSRISELLKREFDSEELSRQIARHEHEKRMLQQSLNQSDQKLSELNHSLAQKEQQLLELQNKLNASTLRIQLLESESQASTRHTEDTLRRLAEVQSRAQQSETRMLEMQQLSNEPMKRAAFNAENLTHTLEIEIQNLRNELESVKQQFFEEHRMRKEQEGQLLQFQSKSNEFNQLRATQDKQINELNHGVQQLMQQVESLYNQLSNESKMKYDAESRLNQINQIQQQQSEENDRRNRFSVTQLQSLEGTIEQLQREIQKYRIIANEEQQRRLESESQKSILGIEIERLNQILKEQLAILETVQRENARLVDSISRVEEHRRGIEWKAAGVEDERNRIIDHLNAQLNEAQTRIQEFKLSKEAMQQDMQHLRSQLQFVEQQHYQDLNDIKLSTERHLADELKSQLVKVKEEYERRLSDALNAQFASYQDDLLKRSRQHQTELNQIKKTLRNEFISQIHAANQRTNLDRRAFEEEKRVQEMMITQLQSQLQEQQAQLMHQLSYEQDAQKWKDIIERLERQRHNEIAEFRVILEESRNLQIDASPSLQEAERTAYITQINQLSRRLSELIENLNAKDHENMELRTSNSNLIREKSELQMQLSLSSPHLHSSQHAIDSLQRQIIESNDARNETQNQLKRTESKLSQYEIQISHLENELNRANEQLNQRKNERDSAYLQLDQLKAQTLSISQAYSSVGGEADMQRSKFQMLQKEIEELTIQRTMYKEQSERKSDELNRKNLELVEKIGQLDQLKLQYQENCSKIYILETKLLDKLQTEEVHIM